MERTLKITEDGSHTLFVNELDEPYHSTHGAIQESMHIFIKEGLQTMRVALCCILKVNSSNTTVAFLTLIESIPLNLNIYYHAVEKYPLTASEYELLNYEKQISQSPKGILHKLHRCPWGNAFPWTETFFQPVNRKIKT